MLGETQRADTRVLDVALARARLRAMRERLGQRLRDFAADSDDGLTATHGSGETEHVVLGVERGISAALDAGVRSALEDVTAALARLDNGTYGACAMCGTPIAIERLEAMPETQWCVSCQVARERALGRKR